MLPWTPVCRHWRTGRPTMLQEFFAGGRRPPGVVVIAESAERPDGLDGGGLPTDAVHYLCGDYTRVEVLEEVGIRYARAVILLTDNVIHRSDQDRDARTVLAALTIERLVPGIYCCAELINGQHRNLLKMAAVEEVVIRDWYAGKLMGTLGRNRGVASVLNDVLSSSEGNAFHTVEVGRGHHGKRIGEVHRILKEEHGAILVSHERGGAEAQKTDVNPSVDVVVEKGDRLVVIGARAPRLR